MLTCFYSNKGGSGVTVTAAAMAVAASRTTPTTILDLAGDMPPVLGLSDPQGPGMMELLNRYIDPAEIGDAMHNLAVEVAPNLRLIPKGGDLFNADAAVQAHRLHLIASLRDAARNYILDAGTTPFPIPLACDRQVLVIRNCYLALRAALRSNVVPTHVVLVQEEKRALTRVDVEATLGLPVMTVLPIDPVIARAADAGLLTARLPRTFESMEVPA